MSEARNVIDFEAAQTHLEDQGYVVLENVLSLNQVAEMRAAVDALFASEREHPFDPYDADEADEAAEDAEIEAYLTESYPISKAELGRLIRRIHHDRKINHHTPWPVPIEDVLKLFLHLPTLFDDDRSQRIWNLLAKAPLVADLVEHPAVLQLVRSILEPDCVLSDCSATSVGPDTEGGAWHVDVPLGQLPEPLPDFALTTQNVFMLDDFTEENGATRIVPRSHKTREKPHWDRHGTDHPDEIALTGPAGSLALWLSNTWHRHGPNSTDHPRRAVLAYYCRSWVKPFTDFRSVVPPDRVSEYAPQVRYLMGFGSNAPVNRG